MEVSEDVSAFGPATVSRQAVLLQVTMYILRCALFKQFSESIVFCDVFVLQMFGAIQ